ncbi:cystathionine beta-lyase [Acinetobacter seifertii]|uniref:cystathionine beta-lyase n=1 Tax=Acinetobacter seifertii TaxID=1530123 RepID=UPI004041F312
MNQFSTDVINLGRTPERFDGLVNTPVFRGSTIVVNSFSEWEEFKRNGGVYRHYGRFGAATAKSFESAISALEGGAGSMVFPSGLSACTHALMACVEANSHVLIADNIYGPTRNFADNILVRMGVSVDYFDSTRLEALTEKINHRTSVVFIESPGSMTFELSDVAAISAISHQYGAKVLVDNSWATPLLFQPLKHGADISIQSVTKYIGGHSDILMGVATANAETYEQLTKTGHLFGETTSPDDIYLASRGLRSLAVRLKQHQNSALTIAQFLTTHPAVKEVLHPALETSPYHDLWLRDFHGSSGVFAFYLKESKPSYVQKFFDSLQLFHIGLSWGGFESLILPVGQAYRTHTNLPKDGYLVRLNIGLESVVDLEKDLECALKCAEQMRVESVI